MSDFYIKYNQVIADADKIAGCASRIEGIGSGVSNVRSALRNIMSSSAYPAIERSLRSIEANVRNSANTTKMTADTLSRIASLYSGTDQEVANGQECAAPEVISMPSNEMPEMVVEPRDPADPVMKSDGYGLEDFIGAFGDGGASMGIGFSLVSALGSNTFKDWSKVVLGGVQVALSTGDDLKRYTKVGRLFGEKKAKSYFLRNFFGFNNSGYASKATTFSSKFYNNLHNPRSIYSWQKTFEPLVGTKGKRFTTKTAAAWAGVLVNGITNFYGNKEEQMQKNGAMSEGRVWAETVTETAIDTIVAYGGSALVGAAITAVTGTVAAPVVVAAATGAAIWAINTGARKLTGQTLTEWVSDYVIDNTIDKAKEVYTGARKAVQSIAGWARRGFVFSW